MVDAVSRPHFDGRAVYARSIEPVMNREEMVAHILEKVRASAPTVQEALVKPAALPAKGGLLDIYI